MKRASVEWPSPIRAAPTRGRFLERGGATGTVRQPDAGAIAVLGALAFIVLIGMGALVVDGGYLAMRRRAMQGVADAAALAGGYSLPTSANAISQARSNATANGYTHGGAVTVTVTSPYAGDVRRIEVIAQTNVPTFLGKALRINTGLVRGRAVATLPPPVASVFAGGDGTCGGQACGLALCIHGTSYDIQGTVHSNTSLVLGGDATDATGPAEHGGGCSGTVNGPVATQSGPTSVPSQPYPLSYTMADFPCTYTMAGTFDVSQPGAWWQSGNAWGGGGVLRPGVYCAPSGPLQLNGSHLSGNVTFVASGNIQISGQFLNMTAFRNNVFLYTTSNANPAVVVGSQDLQWTGAVFAPNGLVNITGTNFTVAGSVIGKYVYLGATNWDLQSGLAAGGPYLSE